MSHDNSNMATLGVIAFRNTSPHPKINILQESNAGNIQQKAEKREVIILRKKPKVNTNNTPQTISVSSIINSQECTLKDANIDRIRKSAKKEQRGQNPPPIAVARRNARERNRVKQVNNGFATLRQHIPNEIAEIYENANSNRTSNKKLSKVETLRMAVEYIRSLENLLKKSDDNQDPQEHTISFPSPASSEQNCSSLDQSQFSLHSPMVDDDDSDSPTPFPSMLGHHYARIPGTNTFHIIPASAAMGFEDEENIHPLTPNSDLLCNDDILVHSAVMDPNMDFSNNPELCAIVQPNMLSPDFYSESSLSPNQESLDIKYVDDMNQHVLYTQSLMLNGQQQEIILSSDNDVINMKINKDVLQNSNVIMTNETLVQLKQEINDNMENDSFQQSNEENMTENITWWPADSKDDNNL